MYLELELTGLAPTEDPFREAKERIARAGAQTPTEASPAAPAAGKKPVTPPPRTAPPPSPLDVTGAAAAPVFPLQPVVYHVEIKDSDGEGAVHLFL